MTELTFTPTLARRLAVTRQRLAGPQVEATPDGIMKVFRDLGCVQIDPIRAVERTQYLTLWSRLGNYDRAHLDSLLWQEKQLFEYWAHAASIVLTEDFPIHQTQMRSFSENNTAGWGRRIRDWVAANQSFRQYILDELRQRGPLFPNQLEDRSVQAWQSGGWTAGRNVTVMLSFLWETGEITVVERKGLRKKWGLLEEHLPQWRNFEALPEAEVVRRAAQKSLRALGVGTAKHIENHFIRKCYPGLDAALTRLTAKKIIVPASIRDSDSTASKFIRPKSSANTATTSCPFYTASG
ncbi:MAG TPA: hypothetical protein G4N96_06675 [Chloroflexi bacterium]|nr:MAG: hypothetical protein B6243_12600 [Anaerolineaceae bacterium 4572_5.2]HEY84777.1 hypothetical protein [Chloroflexota bacterium]